MKTPSCLEKTEGKLPGSLILRDNSSIDEDKGEVIREKSAAR